MFYFLSDNHHIAYVILSGLEHLIKFKVPNYIETDKVMRENEGVKEKLIPGRKRLI